MQQKLCNQSQKQPFFAKLDAIHGYFPLALDEESSYLKNISHPFGTILLLESPSSSSDEWCWYSDFVTESFEFAKKIFDDILIWSGSLEESELCISYDLKKCADINVTLSGKKFAIGTEIPFAGFIILDQGIRPDPQKNYS